MQNIRNIVKIRRNVAKMRKKLQRIFAMAINNWLNGSNRLSLIIAILLRIYELTKSLYY